MEGFPVPSATQREEEKNRSANGNLQGFLLLSILQLFSVFNVWFPRMEPTAPTGLKVIPAKNKGDDEKRVCVAVGRLVVDLGLARVGPLLI